MSAVANATYPSRNTFGSNFFICFLQHFWSLNPARQDSAALTHSGVMGSSRRRRPVAWAKALARAAEVGGSEPSPAPNDGSLRCIRTMSMLGTSVKVRTGYADQSRLVIWRRSKATCSFSVRLTAWTMPPSSWFFAVRIDDESEISRHHHAGHLDDAGFAVDLDVDHGGRIHPDALVPAIRQAAAALAIAFLARQPSRLVDGSLQHRLRPGIPEMGKTERQGIAAGGLGEFVHEGLD